MSRMTFMTMCLFLGLALPVAGSLAAQVSPADQQKAMEAYMIAGAGIEGLA